MHAIPEELSCSQGSLTLNQFENSKWSHKRKCQPLWTFGVENIPVKLQHGTCYSWVMIKFTRPFDLGLVWKFKKVIQRSTSNVTEILMWWTLLSVMLHDAGKFRSVVMFTRCCHPPLFDITYFETSNRSCLRFWSGDYICYNIMHAILKSYCIHKTA